jgi:hypothetical protein
VPIGMPFDKIVRGEGLAVSCRWLP